MPTNKELEARVVALEAEVAALEAPSNRDPEVTYEMFDDVLHALLETLVRSRSQGGRMVAEALRDKYLDPTVSVDSFGEQFTTSQSLKSARGE